MSERVYGSVREKEKKEKEKEEMTTPKYFITEKQGETHNEASRK